MITIEEAMSIYETRLNILNWTKLYHQITGVADFPTTHALIEQTAKGICGHPEHMTAWVHLAGHCAGLRFTQGQLEAVRGYLALYIENSHDPEIPAKFVDMAQSLSKTWYEDETNDEAVKKEAEDG